MASIKQEDERKPSKKELPISFDSYFALREFFIPSASLDVKATSPFLTGPSFSSYKMRFRKEMESNLTILSNLEDRRWRIESYFKMLKSGFQYDRALCYESINQDTNPLSLLPEKKNDLNKKLDLISECLKEVDQLEVDTAFESLLQIEETENKGHSTLTLTERLLIIRCLQEKNLFLKESQTTLQKDLISLLSVLLGKDEMSIKKAYQGSQDILIGKQVGSHQKHYFIQSLQKVRHTIALSGLAELTKLIEDRIKVLELS